MRRNDTPTVPQREPELELALDAAAAAHGARVRAGLSDLIRTAGGFLGFEHFMDYALYAPGLGYYSGGAQKLGSSGDFITAPEVSALFGACVAVQCAEVLARTAQPVILELGAGSGRLAVDVLSRLESSRLLPQRYYILDCSADFRQRQRRLLERDVPHLLERVQWLDGPPAEDFEGVIIANEVLDALPVTRFRWHASAVEELGVVIGAKGFAWGARPAAARTCAAVNELNSGAESWQDGYVSEYCPRLIEWTRTVTANLTRGAALWFDYGLPRAQYYFAQRHEGTLSCHHRHRAHGDPLSMPGMQDITAWVDFTRLAEASMAAGFELAGFTTQAHFLATTGIDQEMQRLAADDAQRFAGLASQARQLMLPGEMGESFKAMAWSRGMPGDLRGFSLADLRHSL